jgi:Na+/H+ antiporter NhaD/arsenite permease-like protein
VSLGWAGYAAIAVFAGAYVLFALREERKAWVAAAGAILGLAIALVALPSSVLAHPNWGAGACALFGYAPSGSPWHLCAAPGVVEWDTLGLLLGLFLLAGLLDRLQVFRWVALRLAARAGGSPMGLFLGLSILSFALSAFINSITVMVVLATITLELCRALGRSPVNLLLAEISCSNVGGAATFVGDPPNVILGTYFGLGFDQFLVYAAPLALAGLAVTLGMFWLLARRDAAKEAAGTGPAVASPLSLPPAPALDRTQVGLALGAFAFTIALLAVNSFIPPSVGEIGLIGAALALLMAGREGAARLLRGVDWSTLAFFFFLFLLIGSLELTGVIAAVASGLGSAGAGSVLLLGILLLWTLGLLSSVVDNVPLAAAAGPVIAAIHANLGVPVGRLVYPSAVGTDIGGNGTPIGASANVVGLSIARRQGVAISWRTYMVRAFPIMLLSLAAATAVLVFWP